MVINNFDPTKYGATPVKQSVNPGGFDPTKFGATLVNKPPTEPQPGAFQSFVQGIAKPFLQTGETAVKAAGVLGGLGAYGLGKLTGNENLQGAGQYIASQSANTNPVDFGYFGKVSPLGVNEQTGKPLTTGEQIKQGIGTGAELGSYFIGGGETVKGAEALAKLSGKQLLKRGIIQGAKEGAVIGGVGAGGAELARPESTLGSVAGQTTLGGTIGLGMGAVAPLAVGGVKTIVSQAKRIVNPEVPDAIFRAIKPGKNNVNFSRDVSTAMPEIADTLKLKNVDTSQMTINDLDSAILDTKKRVWDNYEKVLSPNKHIEIDTKPIADSVRSTITPRTELLNPGLADKINASADAYLAKGKISLGEAENFLHEANGELNAYYAKNKVKQAIARTDPEVMHTLREADALREQLYGKLNELTGVESDKLKKLYGALNNFGNEVSGRAQVANRQAPASLQETIHYPLAVARGLGSLARGDILGAGEAAGQIAMSKAMKEANSTEGLIRKAFTKFNSSRTPILPGDLGPTSEAVGKGIIQPKAGPQGTGFQPQSPKSKPLIESLKSIIAPNESNVKPFIENRIRPKEGGAIPKTSPLLSEARKYKSAEEFVGAQGETLYHGGTVDLSKAEITQRARGNQLPYGIHFTADPKLAESFATGATKGITQKGTVQGAILDIKNPFNVAGRGIYKEGTQEFKILKEIADKSGLRDVVKPYSDEVGSFVGRAEYVGGKLGELPKGTTPAIAPYMVLDNAKMSVVQKVLKDNGYDQAIKYSMKGSLDPLGGGPPVFNDAWAILDKNLIHTKSQLTDIWNKASRKMFEDIKPEAKQLSPSPKVSELPKAPNPLIAEARKYKSAEEFVKAQLKLKNLGSAEGYAKRGIIDDLTNVWNQANEKP